MRRVIRSSHVFGIAGLALCLALTGCGELRGERVVSGVSTSGPASESKPDESSAQTVAVEVRNVAGNGAFSFSSTELFSGNAVLGTELVSDGPVVMSFLVPQCPVCAVAGPDLAASATANPHITYVFVHSGGHADTYQAYIERSGLNQDPLDNVVHLDDSTGLLWARFGVVAQPTNVLIAADGSVTQAVGALSGEQLAEVAVELAAA